MKFKKAPVGTWILDTNEFCIWLKIEPLLHQRKDQDDIWVNAVCIHAASKNKKDEYGVGEGGWSSWNPDAEVDIFEEYKEIKKAFDEGLWNDK